jgi:hypothetical protein
MRPNLVIVRAGDESLHERWLDDGAQRTFDLFVSYYGDNPSRFKENADFYEFSKGLKWPALFDVFSRHRNLLTSYKGFWFPDDDLLTDCRNVCRMFELLHDYDLWLAQPALQPGSYASHPVTLMVQNVRLRFTDFVEIMCPLFSTYSLRSLFETFSYSMSGWGLDFLWPHLLGYPENRIAILDETPVKHTRPLRTGSSYDYCSRAGIRPRAELRQIVKKYQIYRQRRPRVIQIYRTVLAGNSP